MRRCPQRGFRMPAAAPADGPRSVSAGVLRVGSGSPSSVDHVAVPAQEGAGVTKKAGRRGGGQGHPGIARAPLSM